MNRFKLFFKKTLFLLLSVSFALSISCYENNQFFSHLKQYENFEHEQHDNLLADNSLHVHKHGPDDKEHHHHHDHQVSTNVDIKIENKEHYLLDMIGSVVLQNFDYISQSPISFHQNIFRPPIHC